MSSVPSRLKMKACSQVGLRPPWWCTLVLSLSPVVQRTTYGSILAKTTSEPPATATYTAPEGCCPSGHVPCGLPCHTQILMHLDSATRRTGDSELALHAGALRHCLRLNKDC